MRTIDDYLAWCERRALRPRYVTEIRRTLTRVACDLGPPAAVNATKLEVWWESLPVKPATRNVYLAHLSGYYRWVLREGLRADDPTEGFTRPRTFRRLPRPIDDERLRRAMRLAPPVVACFLALASLMGLRACEIAALNGEDIQGTQLLVSEGKGGRQRVVPIHPAVAELLDALDPPTFGPVFLNSRGAQISANTLSHRANGFLHRNGIPESIHQLRHWFGTNVYRTSQDLRLTQELLGHQSPITTSLYVAWGNDKAAEVIGQLTA